MAKRWYVVHAKTGGEELAALNLRRQNFEVFLPLSHRTTRHARKIRTTRTAFFPGYLFVAIDVEIERWRSIDGTLGVLALIKAGDRPLATPVGLVEAVKALSCADGVVDLARGLGPGARVRVVGGPFADQLATVEGLRGPDRVRVLLSMMSQAVPVEIARRALTIVPA